MVALARVGPFADVAVALEYVAGHVKSRVGAFGPREQPVWHACNVVIADQHVLQSRVFAREEA